MTPALRALVIANAAVTLLLILALVLFALHTDALALL